MAEAVRENGTAQTSIAEAAEGPSVPKDTWKNKYLILKRKCERIDQSNDVLYAKSRQISKMIQRAETEKRVLMRRLEQYEVEVGESRFATSAKRFKMAGSVSPPPPFPPSTLPHSVFTSPTPDPSESNFVKLRQDVAPSLSSKPRPPTFASLLTETNSKHHHLLSPAPPPPTKKALDHLTTDTQPASSSSASPSTKPTKRTRGSAKGSAASRRKKDADSGAPKKPSNAFFWFCQEQRGSLEDQFRGEGVAGQHSLTKILAQKWGETSTEDKKKYYLKYLEDKKRYESEMQVYRQKKQELQEQQQLQPSATATQKST